MKVRQTNKEYWGTAIDSRKPPRTDNTQHEDASLPYCGKQNLSQKQWFTKTKILTKGEE